MKSSTRSLLLATGAATLAVSAAWWLTTRGAAPSDGPALPVCPGLQGVQPVTLEVTPPSGAAWSAVLVNGRWSLPSLAGVPAMTDPLGRFVRALSSATLDEGKSALPENHAKLALIEPRNGSDTTGAGTRVRILGLGGQVLADVILGKYAPEGGYFVRRTAESQAWVSRDLPHRPSDALDFADRRLASLPAAKFKSATLTPVLSKPLTITTPPQAGADGKTPAYPWKTAEANRILGTLAWVQLDDAKENPPEGQPVLLRLDPANAGDCAVEARLWPSGADKAMVQLKAIAPPKPLDPPALLQQEKKEPPPPPPPGIAEAERLNGQWGNRVYEVGGDLAFAARQNHATLEAPPQAPAPGKTETTAKP